MACSAGGVSLSSPGNRSSEERMSAGVLKRSGDTWVAMRELVLATVVVVVVGVASVALGGVAS